MRSIMQICLQRSTGLRYLLQHQAKLQEVQNVFAQCLPASLTEHVRVANLRQQVLYLHVDNSAWASKARFFIPQFLSCCKQHRALQDIRSIQLKVRTPAASQPVEYNKPQLSRDNAELISIHAELTHYEPLRKALLKLAQHADRKRH